MRRRICSIFVLVLCSVLAVDGQMAQNSTTVENTDMAETTTTEYIEVPTTTPSTIICLKNTSEPPFLPNVYYCKNVETCCINDADFACCGTEVTNNALMEQAYTWIVIVSVLVLVGAVAACYFKDRYCCDGDVGLLEKKRRYKKEDFHSFLFPKEMMRKRVDDPIFGRTGTADDIPHHATITIN